MKEAAYTTHDARWQAVQTRDKNACGYFVYGVRTTGVYCHPGSPARLPKRENVDFFDSPEKAEAAGYRPSQHAQKDDAANTQLIARACQRIEQSDTAPSLEKLATESGLSRFHFHRLFKAHTGLTPKAYANAHRARKLRQQLAENHSVTETLYQVGFNSSSRFYEKSDSLLGMKASHYRQGGKNETLYFAVAQCSLGALLVAESERGICAILMDDDPAFLVRDLQHRFPHAELIGGDKAFEKKVAQVVGFVESPAIGLSLPLDIRGTAFQERVWQALRDIPPGKTASYTDIANRIGKPKSVRAVAQACGANALAVAVPCHRIVRLDGDLSGYRWGIERKRELLKREESENKKRR